MEPGTDQPLDPATLEVGRDYVFFYPFRATPCFLIDLGEPTARDVSLATEDGNSYHWPGGVGPNRSIVAFSAICAHRMAHPTPSVSFIGYRPDTDRYMDKDKVVQERARVIHCCSENSVYDPAEGCRVLGGPAPQPLAAIELEVNADGHLVATGVFGPTQFDRFFDTYGHRLELEFGSSDLRHPIEGETPVTPLDAYTRHQIRC
jgi:Rieske Fe-S protein